MCNTKPFFFLNNFRKANDGLSKVSRQSGNEHVDIRDFANKHIMSYGNLNIILYSFFMVVFCIRRWTTGTSPPPGDFWPL